jgi:hypothetical protein
VEFGLKSENILRSLEMKKKILKVVIGLFVALTLGFGFTACGGGGDNGPVWGVDNSLVGYWYSASGASLYDGGTDLGPSYTFATDGTWDLLSKTTDPDNTWTASGGTLLISLWGLSPGTIDYSITGDTLTLSNDDASGLVEGTYYRRPKTN